MITAKEAKELTNSSDTYLEMFSEWISKKIEEEAKKGKSEYVYRGGGAGDATTSREIDTQGFANHFILPIMWQRITHKMKSAGFSVTCEFTSPTERPRGMDSSSSWQNLRYYHLKFNW